MGKMVFFLNYWTAPLLTNTKVMALYRVSQKGRNVLTLRKEQTEWWRESEELLVGGCEVTDPRD